MPKEFVDSKYRGETYPVKVNDVEVGRRPVEETRVVVGWSKEGEHVQIATIAPDSEFMQLDRDGLNRLIRLLRKARDGAYGADA